MGSKSTARFYDFDAARREKRKQPTVMRVLGEDVDLPGAMPAWLAFEVARAEEEHGDDWEPSNTIVETWMRRLFGSDRVDRMLEELDFDEMMDLFERVFDLLAPDGDSEDGDEDPAGGEGDEPGED
jgi:hypothetical protein